MKTLAALKLKDSREASDAGLLIWRRNFVFFLLLFAIPFWITAFVTLTFLPGELQYLAYWIIWLLKPFFDRIILHIISVRFFENGAGLKRVCQGMGKSLVRGLAGDLLWRRFSPIRSAIMPVRVLELNIKSGKRFTERKRILEKGGIGYCFFLTIWGISLEAALLLGEIVFFMTMGELLSGGFIYSLNEIDNIGIYIFAAWCVNYILIESIYVCMGFSLYINSRIDVEGWDIEISFRNFAEKTAEKIKNGVIFAFVFALLFLPAKASAQEPPENNAPLETLQSILASPDFGSEKDTWGIRLKKTPDNNKRASPEIDSESLKRVQEIVAYTLRFILIGLIAGFIIFIFLYIRKYHRKETAVRKKTAEKIVHAYHAEEPTLLLEKALRYNEQGKTRLAWGYCTAAAIQSWNVYRGISFSVNATENDCADIVRAKSAEDAADEFTKLIKHWVYFAYAGRLPPEGSFNKAVDLCVSLRTKNG